MCLLILISGKVHADLPSKIDYNQHIRPLLSDACFKCHGSDEKQRKGKLRLDVREDALIKKAIVPGKPDESEMVKRIITTDDEDLMPPAKEHHPLKPGDKELLHRWIAEGAEYKNHWAFIPVMKPPLPADSNSVDTNPIDAFVLSKLAEQKLQPAAPASKEQWLRRVTFALTGLPPTTRELDDFLADGSDQARAHVVDRLIATDAHAEHLAKDWLDAARYADSYGRHEDGDMTVWPWRDWVIKAFKENMPYDQFVTWQTAGDLLPNPTREQLVATAFNRLALQSNESGSDPEEFRLDQVSDRVRANGMAFMGLTLECAKCHDHKYDPISQREYWQMAAMFDNIDENGVYSQFCPLATPSPSVLLPTSEQQAQLDDLWSKIDQKENDLKQIADDSKGIFKKWIAQNGIPGMPVSSLWNSLKMLFGSSPTLVPWDAHAKVYTDFEHPAHGDAKLTKTLKNIADPSKPIMMRAKLEAIPGPRGHGALMKGDDEISIPRLGDFHEYDDLSFALWLQPREHRERAAVVCLSRGANDDGRGCEVILQNEVPSFALMHFFPGTEIRIKARKPLPLNEWSHLAVTYDGSSKASGMKMYLNGVLLDTEVIHDHLSRDIVRRPEWGDKYIDQVKFTMGGREHDSPLKECGVDEYWVFGRAISPGEVKQLAGVPTSADDWLEWWLMKNHKPWKAGYAELTKLREERTKITNDLLEIMIMKELPVHRQCFIRTRGDYRQRGEEVQPGAVNAVLPFDAKYPKNRLGFAQWLTSREHPLTSRVAVNRVWQLMFGRGLTSSPQDFGVRGEIPSHPELMDWLAADFMENGWNVRRLVRSIALSSTFAQSAIPSDPRSLETDPDNRWLARGPVVRLSAEELRDQALACSGLLVPKVGGPSVRPYMPFGLYHDSGLQQSYNEDVGEGLYRRSMYSFWRRTLPPPELGAFDAPSREFCVVKREKTTTPLQSLALLNAPQFVEAQRVCAEQLVKQYPADDQARCGQAFRLLTSRKPVEQESAILCSLLKQHREHFQGHAEEAKAVLQNGAHPADPALPPHEIAATAMVLRTLMSHVEAMNR